MAEVVGRVDDGPVAGEPVEHVGVAPGVLAVAVRDQHHAARRALGVATADDDAAVRAVELQVGLGPDHAEVSSRRQGWAVVTPRTVRTTRSGSSHIGTWPTRGRRTNSAPGRRARSVSPWRRQGMSRSRPHQATRTGHGSSANDASPPCSAAPSSSSSQDRAAAEVVDQVGDVGGRHAVAALEHPAEQEPPHPGPRRHHAHRGRAAERRAEAERPHQPAQVESRAPAPGRRQRDHRAGAPAAGELEGHPAAQRVADEVRGRHAGGVHQGLDVVDDPRDPDRLALGPRRAAAVPDHRRHEHVVVRLEAGQHRAPRPPRHARAVQQHHRLAAPAPVRALGRAHARPRASTSSNPSARSCSKPGRSVIDAASRLAATQHVGPWVSIAIIAAQPGRGANG